VGRAVGVATPRRLWPYVVVITPRAIPVVKRTAIDPHTRGQLIRLSSATGVIHDLGLSWCLACVRLLVDLKFRTAMGALVSTP